MKFRLLSFPVNVSWTFALMAGLLGWQREDLGLIVAWILVAFVSVLIHELGHAAAARVYGANPAIFMHYMGGHTSFALSGHRRGPHIVVAVAGPTAGFLFGGAVFLVQGLSGVFTASPLSIAYRDILWVNFGWGLINLLPTLPLDGGHIVEALIPHPRRVVLLSLAVSVLAAALGLWSGYTWAALLFGVFAYSHFNEFRAMPKGPAPQRSTPPPGIPRQRSSEPEWAREARRRAREQDGGGA